MSRRLRSHATSSELTTNSHSPIRFVPNFTLSEPRIIFNKSLPDLNSTELQNLRQKQTRLRKSISSTVALARETSPQAVRALKSTLIFGQAEAGTAVCIDARGWILTCAHCFGETRQEWQTHRRKWLLYYTGLAVQVECRVWDPRRDLAMAKVIHVEMEQPQPGDTDVRFPIFSYISPAKIQDPTESIFCIGQPGADDLESSMPRKTAYDWIEVSEGRLCGLIPNVDPHDNSEIGVLKHDAWTYWGHSGAPLLRSLDGTLVGLHSSWDDSTAMRHGIPLVAIRAFLEANLPARSAGPVHPAIELAGQSKSDFIVINSSE
ncbi:uncharacterized protein N7511_001373 [Penicillium nucicola]|uniref:uncharacterized protein n=1 Tax=Penicillium nucicola TaxID=1850975 RepID=UPI0025458027|nr:uncharacterized protein N7511_001373 [Penicillium nucicola]KAJ5776362.1 hypothetical protein N7511_001373 [Penicillium nucicola]